MARGTLYARKFLDNLRKAVIATLQQRLTGSDNKLDNNYVVRTPNSVNSKAYGVFKKDIEDLLVEKVIAVGTLFKFLYRSDNELSIDKDKEVRTFMPDRIELLTEYVAKGSKIQTKETNKSKFQGGYIIDANFKSEREIASKSLIAVKFYTTKLDPENQWLGVIGGLDYERRLLKQVEAEVLLGFERASKVSAVITGPHGTGKSTFLRKLAINCIKYSKEKFKTIWINDLFMFYQYDLLSIISDDSRYLLIIEDWTVVAASLVVTPNFFTQITNTNNIRVVIGDVSPTETYTQFVYSKNFFELEPAENKDILLHVLDHVEQWKGSANRALQNVSLYRAPLFLILFVIAKDSEEQGNLLNIDTEDFVSQFNFIIKKDLVKIYNSHPGLSKALYYWANVVKHYGFKTIFVWEELLKWADCYCNFQHFSDGLIRYDESHPTCKILSQYFDFDEIFNPLSKNKYHISFLNDSFINAFCFSPCDDWYFDKILCLAIAESLASVNIKHTANEFLWGYLKEMLKAIIIWPETEPWDYPRFRADVDKILYKEPYKHVIDKINEIEDPKDFQISSFSLKSFINNVYPYSGNIYAELAGLCFEPDGHKNANKICTFLIENGCEMIEIKQLLEATKSRESLQSFCDKHCSWYWYG